MSFTDALLGDLHPKIKYVYSCTEHLGLDYEVNESGTLFKLYVTCSSNFIQCHWMVLGTQEFQHHPMPPSKACKWWIQYTLYFALKYTDWKLNQRVNPFQQGLPEIHFCSFWKGRRSVLKDCCAIADNTVLPPETVVPPFTLYSGSPGKCSYS